MGALRRYSTLLVLTVSFAGSSTFVACGSSDTGRKGAPGSGGTGGDSGLTTGGSSSGGSGGSTGGSSAGGADAAPDAPDAVTSNGDANADGAG